MQLKIGTENRFILRHLSNSVIRLKENLRMNMIEIATQINEILPKALDLGLAIILL